MKNIFKIAILSLGIVNIVSSCSNDFVDREFEQSVIQSDLKSLQEVQSFVRGAYASMRASTYYGRDFTAYGEVRSDEMFSNGRSGYFQTVRTYTMTSSDAYARDTYNQIYTMIAKTNIVIGTDVSKLNGTAQDLQKAEYYQGQAYALRAQGFFDLLRLYGQKYTGGTLGVVTPLKYDPKALKARSTITETEAQIEADFNKALSTMTSRSSFDTPSNKTELSINALKVLMSRYYLYKGDYAKVRTLISEVYSKYNVVARDLYQPSFDYTLRGAAPNSIFELEVGTDSSLSTSSYNQVLSVNGYYNLVALASSYNLYATNDIRKSLISYLSAANGAKYYFLSAGSKGKYLNRTGADNIKMVRYEEALLNGAEAELQPGGDPAKALKYYKDIQANRLDIIYKLQANGSPELDANGNPIVLKTVQQQLDDITSVDLNMIKVERRKELLGEGFRQWDLLRWGNTSFKPADVSANLLAFPIPRQETDIAGTPVVANPGYDN
jgi:hypothetical protein